MTAVARICFVVIATSTGTSNRTFDVVLNAFIADRSRICMLVHGDR
jgi:hypothetical protein